MNDLIFLGLILLFFLLSLGLTAACQHLMEE
jgi:hypothetical protein